MRCERIIFDLADVYVIRYITLKTRVNCTGSKEIVSPDTVHHKMPKHGKQYEQRAKDAYAGNEGPRKVSKAKGDLSVAKEVSDKYDAKRNVENVQNSVSVREERSGG